MASINLTKYIIVLLLASQELVAAVTQYLTENLINTNGAQPNIYSEIPQEYYVPYQKYVPTSTQKYTAQRESQIPISTEKTLFSPNYKVTLDTTKYITAEVAKSPQVEYSNNAVYPYVYTLTKAGPSTTATYPSDTENSYHDETPKKYHYGYRVSNPETGTEFGHSEVNDGLSARGYYHVLLPDGRLQNVKYWAGPSGYHATITYESKY